MITNSLKITIKFFLGRFVQIPVLGKDEYQFFGFSSCSYEQNRCYLIDGEFGLSIAWL